MNNPTIDIDSANNACIIWEKEDEANTDHKAFYSKINKNAIKVIDNRDIGDLHSSKDGPSFALDRHNDIHLVYQDIRNEQLDVYYKKLDSEGKIIFNDIQITNTKDYSWTPVIAVDTNENVFIVWEQGISLNAKSQLSYVKSSNSRDLIIEASQITFLNDSQYNYNSLIRMDSDNNIHVPFDNDGTQWYIKIANIGSILIPECPLSTIATIPNSPIISDNNGNLLYLDDNGIVDSNNNIHIITSNSASLLYTKLNRTGAKLFENKTIATHDMKKNYDHGPTIFDPKVAIDFEDNIHITWYINEGGNHFSIWYEKIDPNGTVLIPAMKVAPEHENEDDGIAWWLVGVVGVVIIIGMILVLRKTGK